MRRFLLTALLVGSVAIGTATSSSPTTTVASTRQATQAELDYCVANYDSLGPVTNDCHLVPLAGTIEEDDPWDRWDCRLDGDHICDSTIYFLMADGNIEAYDLNDPDRPGCFVEPSNTHERFEVVFYRDMGDRTETLGFEVTCSNTKGHAE